MQLIMITYLVICFWLALFVYLTVPVILWTMMHIVCREETDYWRSIDDAKDERNFTYVFNLTQYGR